MAGRRGGLANDAARPAEALAMVVFAQPSVCGGGRRRGFALGGRFSIRKARRANGRGIAALRAKALAARNTS
jgi:hypothetical protein